MPENFNVSSEVPEEGRILVREALPYTQEPAHLESALPPELARRVVERALLQARPVLVRLTVEGDGDSVSVELPLRVDPTAASGFRLTTPVDAEGIEFVLDSRTDGRGTLQFDVHYAGLPVNSALSYARFLRALYWDEGTLYLSRLEPNEERFELVDLPLPLDPATKGETEDRVRFLEALNEIGRATGSALVYPSELDDGDLRNLNHVLKVIRGGWVALPVTDFTTPTDSEGVKNILHLVHQRGEVVQALAMTSQGERYKIFDTWVDLGPSIRYLSGARLVTPRSEMEEWLTSEPGPDGSFEVRWVPVDGAWVHVFYQEWPKPSLEGIRDDIRAFEEENGRRSDEFRLAWENDEAWAHQIEDGDVWLTLLDAERHLKHGN
jgi:hypothetical protein